MSEDIPYGPDREPWKKTVSPLAIGKDGALLITPPSQDPAKIYDFPEKERGITPYYYQIPSLGLSADHTRKAQDQTHEYVETQSSNFLGYQSNFHNDMTIATGYLYTSLNNLGDPFVPGNFTVGSRWMERNVLDYYASLWNAKWPHDEEDPDTYWGYVTTMGSSEGNLYGIWNARDYLQGKFMMTDVTKKIPTTLYVQAKAGKGNENAFTPVAFFSEDSHYSLIKSTTVLEIKTFYELGTELYPNDNPLGGDWPTEVPSEGGDTGPGSIDVDKLITLVEFFAQKGYPALVIMNYGTTFKGAYDDVKAVGEKLVPMLKKYDLDERWIEVTNPNDPDDSKFVKRKGYWIHIDGALGASYVPFLRMAFDKGRTDIVPPPQFDFKLPYVCSICTSGHKWPGAPWPLGIFMTKTGYQLLPPTTPDYIGSPDTTFAGSRNGLSAIVWWTFLSDNNYESQVEKTCHSLDLVKYAREQLEEVEKEIGRDLWIEYTPLALALWFMKPNDDLVHKYSLAVDNLQVGNELRPYVHIYIMANDTKKMVDNLMDDLRKSDAFPPNAMANTKSSRRWLRRARKTDLEKRIDDLHEGMIVGKADLGLRKGVKPLLQWPSGGRGFL